MKGRKEGTMGMIPALAAAVILRINWFQGDLWIDVILEHTLTAFSSFIGAKLAEIIVSAAWMPIFGSSLH